MDSTFDVADPTDWLDTPVAALAPVESALRCQVCKDFFNTPVITSCSHTFCSLCIRRCLTNDGKCPTCRTVDQELKLRPNWIVQELVDSFAAARPKILQLGKDALYGNATGTEVAGKKRKFTPDEEDAGQNGDLGSRTPRRKTRSQAAVNSDRLGEVASDEAAEQDDGFAACPICGKRMPEEKVFSHLDIHQEGNDGSSTRSKAQTPIRIKDATTKARQAKPLERLPQLNYSLLNDGALRKKFEALGIPNHGNRNLLIRRHTEWVNLWNSNCDSKTPRGKRELLHDLDVWERTQGRQNQGSGGSAGTSVMDKDFDSAAWASKHEDDFQKLIAKAKAQKRNKPPEDRADEQYVVKGADAGDQTHPKRCADEELRGPVSPVPNGDHIVHVIPD